MDRRQLLAEEGGRQSAATGVDPVLPAALDGDQELAAQLNAPAAQQYPRATERASEKEPVGTYRSARPMRSAGPVHG